MNKLTFSILAALALLGAEPVVAQIQLAPTPVTGEARMVTFDYDTDRTYKVLVRPKNNTQIQLEKGELVTYVSAGDAGNFIITVPSSREFVEIKPKWESVSTNLLVVTNRRTYHIDLQSTGEDRKWYMRVAWTYADKALYDLTQAQAATPVALEKSAQDAGEQAHPSEVLAGVSPEKMSFGYEIEGEGTFKPTQVFDDGSHTFIRMPEKLQELPALFMIPSDSDEIALVNYSVRPPYLVVQRTMERFVLKIGKTEVNVKRQPRSKSWFRTAEY